MAYILPRPLDCYGDDSECLAQRPKYLGLAAWWSRNLVASRRKRGNPSLRLMREKRGKKMAGKKERKFQEVKSDLPPVWEPEVGDILEGIFLGSKSIKYRTKNFLTHQIQNEDTGEILSFSGAISDRMMARIPKMSYVRVTYLGETKTSNGDAKNFKIEADDSVKLIEEDLLDGSSQARA